MRMLFVVSDDKNQNGCCLLCQMITPEWVLFVVSDDKNQGKFLLILADDKSQGGCS